MKASTQTDLDLRGFIKSSLVEWEGRICAVVFTARCNWRCPYCHGRVFVNEPESLPPIPEQDVYDLLEAQRGWIDGVAITGGEPTLQPGLTRFIREIRSRGAAVKLETNGTHPEVIAQLLSASLIDCLCMDYKAPLDKRLMQVTSVPESATGLAAVKQSFAIAAASGIEREYHTTLCPRFIDATVIAEMARDLEPGGLWVLQQYETGERLDPEAAGELRYDEDELEKLAEIARKHHGNVLLRKGKAL